jgi:hypothetical protein
VQHQVFQHAEGAGGQGKLLADQSGLAGLAIQHQVAADQPTVTTQGQAAAAGAAQHRPYARDQLQRLEGLVEVIVGALLQAERSLSRRADLGE